MALWTRVTARELDGRLKQLVMLERRAEAEVAAALLEMKRRRLFHVLGFSRLQDYAEAELDMSRAKAKALVEIAGRLEGLPAVRRAFGAGELCWTKARLVVRAATAGTEEAWLERARGMSVRALEGAVQRERGEPEVVRVMLELTPGEMADLEVAVGRLREERGEAVALGSAVAELCRRTVGGAGPAHRIVIQECPTCARVSRDTREGPIEVAPQEVQAARADAEVLDLRGGGTGVFRRTVKPSERRAVFARAGGRCELCGAGSWLHLHHVERRDGDPSVLCLLCSGCHQGLVHGGHVTVTGRAPGFEFRLRDGSPAPTPTRSSRAACS